MINREERITFLTTEDERVRIENAATERGTNLSDLIRSALDLYMELPPNFIKGIEKDATEYRLNPGTFIAYLFTAFTSMTAAMVVEGLKTPVFQFAFRITNKGMMDAHSAGILTFKEVQGILQEIKRAAVQAKKKGRDETITSEIATGIMGYALEPVKPEVKFNPRISAKGK